MPGEHHQEQGKTGNGVVAITGASGFVGGRLVQWLAARPECTVHALIRRGQAPRVAEGARIEVVRGDIVDPAVLAQLLTPGCDVLNFAYDAQASAHANLTSAAALAEACAKHRVRRVLHCSTAVVAGRARAKRIDESTACEPTTEYEKTKLALEDLLREKARGRFALAILRPTGVFGAGGRNLVKLAHDLAHGPRLVNYLRSCVNGRRRMHLVDVGNVIAAAAFLLATDARIDQEVFIIADDDAAQNNFRDVENCLMRALGVREYVAPRPAAPAGVLSLLLRLRGRSQSDPTAVFSSEKLRGLGFSKPVEFTSGLASFAAWYNGTRAAGAR